MKKMSHHILIKFTPNDNIKTEGQQLGWVEYFATFLKTCLQYQVEEEVNISFKNEVELITKEDFDNADLIFYILSPAMIFASNINQDSMELEQAFSFNIPLINAKIKKVFKAPVDIADLPLSISTPTYYRFFDNSMLNEDSYETYEGWNKYQENDNYWRVFADVLTDTLAILKKEKVVSESSIFISDKNKSYYHHRDVIKREVKAFNHKIFPDEDFSIESNYMADPEEFFMKQSDLAIHFPDEFIGLTREKRNNAFKKVAEMKRLIWFSPEESSKPEKKALYDELKVQLKPYPNIEAIESTIEEFKEIIKENISKIKLKTTTEQLSPKQIIYIISDSKIDHDTWQLLQNDPVISDQFDLKLIDNVKNVADYRHLHYDLLRKADYFFILYFKSNQLWLSAISSEIKKAPGFRNEKQILGQYILCDQNTILNDDKLKDFQLIKKKDLGAIVDIIKKLAV